MMYTLKNNGVTIKANISLKEALETLQAIGRKDYTQIDSLALYVGQSKTPLVTGQEVSDFIGKFFF